MPPGMPNVDPAKYMSAMQRVMGNPQFLEAAESLGKSLLTQVCPRQWVGGGIGGTACLCLTHAGPP